ncbi:hypothetical protein [Nitratireductor sp. OM-1]|uniref:hypothetical protein n=1 Tax=Nitratireductor sp. OM-1 TaxID=1756988 RepID=UPI000DDE730B|nr:hypothetical protein [Nitratireductor sp. OM-1]
MADLFEQLPKKGEIWEHTKTGGRYEIEGSTFNTLTDTVDVSYIPLYACEYSRFNRQLLRHPKAFMSKNEDGTPRFSRVEFPTPM